MYKPSLYHWVNQECIWSSNFHNLIIRPVDESQNQRFRQTNEFQVHSITHCHQVEERNFFGSFQNQNVDWKLQESTQRRDMIDGFPPTNQSTNQSIRIFFVFSIHVSCYSDFEIITIMLLIRIWVLIGWGTNLKMSILVLFLWKII